MLAYRSLCPSTRLGRFGLARLFLVLAGTLAAVGCAGRIYVVSSLGTGHKIVVDGDTEDWGGGLSYAAKEHVFVGFVNQGDELYTCLSRVESGGRPGAPESGVTVWIDPSGGTEKTLGFRLAALPEGSGTPGREPREPEQGEERPPDAEGGRDIEVLGPEGNVVKTLTPEEAAEAGLEIRSGFSSGSYILEARIPLRRTGGHPFAVGAGPGETIGVGFTSTRSERGRRFDIPPGGGGMPPGGVGGVGVGGGMGGGGMKPGMRPNLNPDVGKSLKVWIRVRLDPAGGPARMGAPFGPA